MRSMLFGDPLVSAVTPCARRAPADDLPNFQNMLRGAAETSRREALTRWPSELPTGLLAARRRSGITARMAGAAVGVTDDRISQQRIGQPCGRAACEVLSETGYPEGCNVAIEYRWADNQNDQLPALLADLVRQQVSVIVASGSTPAALAAKAAPETIPIICSPPLTPVMIGLVTKLARPGGDITGVSPQGVDVGPKRLDLLHEIRTAA
jgi:ABC transporter substrate binding protein